MYNTGVKKTFIEIINNNKRQLEGRENKTKSDVYPVSMEYNRTFLRVHDKNLKGI